MPLLPFESRSWKTLERSEELLRIQINSAMSPIWFFLIAFILFFHPDDWFWILVPIMVLVSTMRKHLVFLRKQGILRIETRLLSIPVSARKIRFADIQDCGIKSEKQPEGHYMFFLVLRVMEGDNEPRDIRVMHRMKSEQLTRLTTLLKGFMPIDSPGVDGHV